MRVTANVAYVMLPSEKAMRDLPGVRATCSRCGHTTESFGEDSGSVKRCLAMLNEECPKDENNYYVDL